MSALSDFSENELVKHFFRTGSFTKPTALYVALFTVTPTDAGGGTEVTGGSYAQVDCPPLDANWAATSGTDGHSENVADVVFPTPTADWGQVVAFAIFSALTAGDMYLWGPLTTPKTINNGDPAPKFSAGALDVTFA